MLLPDPVISFHLVMRDCSSEDCHMGGKDKMNSMVINLICRQMLQGLAEPHTAEDKVRGMDREQCCGFCSVKSAFQ